MALASPSAVYGNSPELPKVETLRPHPVSPYAVSKLFLETYAAVIPKFITALIGGRVPAEPLYEAPHPGDIKHSYADISLSADGG